jgi:CheY-like chemotaxis protein
MESLVLVLRTMGFHAEGEISASAALQTAELLRPDILLCDIQLDNRNGVELSLDIDTILPGCRIILMSGDTTSTRILAEAHEHGHDFEVLAKPIPPEELLALLGPASPLLASAAKVSGRTLGEHGFTERRRQQRVRFESAATVTAGEHSIAASAKDITDRGLFFFTDARIEVGSEIDIVITLPEEAGLPLCGMVCCHGHVVRSDFHGGQYGLGVQIERLAPVSPV